jgi:hypothetical protein
MGWSASMGLEESHVPVVRKPFTMEEVRAVVS